MAGVNVPAPSYDPMKTIVPAAGAAVGGFFGGPAGAIAGQKVGGALVEGGPDAGAVQSTAIDRRISTLQDDPNVQLAQAGAALKQMSPDDQAAYGPTIAAAQQRAAKGGT